MGLKLRRLPAFALLGLCFAALGPGARAAQAQYFGRNKVQYETFKFQVLHTDHFDVYFYPEESQAAEQAARLAERWYARYTRFFGHELSSRQPLILYASHSAFEQTNAIPGDLGEGTGGVTEAIRRRIVLPLGSSLAESDHVIGHELVHAFQYDITGNGGRGPGGLPTATQMPLWFVEGMAEFLSLGPLDPHTAMWMRDAALRNKLPTYRQLDDPRFFPYRYGQALWAYVAGRYGDQMVVRLLRGAGRNGDVSQAISREMGISGDSLVKAWKADLVAAYEPLRAKTQEPERYGRQLIAGKTEETGLNVGPVVSPDGSRIVFYSARDLFSIEMFLWDAGTGQVVRRVTKTAVDPHFQSLEFINSAGSFDASGDHFVFSALANGRPVLDLIDVATGNVHREISFPSLGEILHPAWSPDGRSIAFAAQAGGLTDLYLYDLEADSLRKLTDDAYADLEPAWSPDGRKIAFVTDRFSTDTVNLRAGNYRLALMDVASGRIEPLPSFEDAKNINPVWSPDGSSIYFLSDRGGITNIYRLDVATGERTQVTNLLTGVTGITSLSPALSIARRTGRLVYSIYQAGNYAVYDADSASVLAGQPLAPVSAVSPSPALLPPQNREPGELERLLADSKIGEDAAATQSVTAYRPRLGLDYVAQPYLAVGASSYGTFVGGGVTLYWSDMLGDRNLATMLQVSGSLKNLAGLVAYQNSQRRLNWGIAVQQIPYITGGYGLFQDSTGNVYQQIEILRQTNRSAQGLFAYPLSQVQRIEWSAGVQNISFDAQVETQVFNGFTGQLMADSVTNLPAPPSITLATASAALVYDNSFFGATSPVLGQRYRLEVSPAVGTMGFYTLLADYRRYFMPQRPFTIATRLVHYGRYGPDAEDGRLYPLFIGYQSFVRGYDNNSFDASECVPVPGDDCPVFNRLLGSRLLVGNLELRFPLLGVLGLGHGYYGAFPIEAAVFTDAGVAWHKDQTPALFGGSRQTVTSAGFAARINLLGFAVIEVDYVRPFQRPGKGWLWQFGFVPGF